jgi:hypothetical protein
MAELAAEAGLEFQILDWAHPRQTWALFAKEKYDESLIKGDPISWNRFIEKVLMDDACTNSEPAPVPAGLNTLPLSASAPPLPHISAIADTPTGDGIVNLPGVNGSNAFSVSTMNVGSTGTITVTPSSSQTLPLVMSICETNASGVCLSGPASETTSPVNGGATPTYSIFVTATGTVPFDPANNRIIVEFKDAGGVVRGSTSVAVRTQ